MAGEPEKVEIEALRAENKALRTELARLEREIEYMEMSGFQPVRRTRHREDD